LAAFLGACAVAPSPNSLDFDPFEAQNREVHEANKAVDRSVYGPVARGYGQTVPQPVRRGITNLRDHWRLPGHAIQYTLQGRPLRVAETTMRFAINSAFGFAGLLDPAAEMDLPYRQTNFDETFYVWGFPEGGYLELAAVGPGTQRDWFGYALDQALDPMYYVLPVAATNGLLALGGLDIVNDRYELDPVLEELLHTSADSYTAQRISYLQNMRARLQGGTSVEELEDVYADF
jgi:phospholipid-binding lipoprotein MlaA